MTQHKRIAIDIAKSVFTLHGIDQEERAILRINLRRGQLIGFSQNFFQRSLRWKLVEARTIGLAS
jgi:hypothetical protein